MGGTRGHLSTDTVSQHLMGGRKTARLGAREGHGRVASLSEASPGTPYGIQVPTYPCQV